MSVEARIESLELPTYPVGKPEKNPMFFEKRVYQGSCGKVYPLPFIDKVYDEPQPVRYQAARLENDFVRLVMLPEIGGRIFTGQDKSNSNYDFFYRQDVIKPALVGLAGPWISGGVEFNWPQHHRPGTFMPADVSIEHEADGSATVWMSEHDPLTRMKGMHGIRLRPGSSLIELRARLYNRTPQVQTFLWWANVAAMVHDQYQSFFPPDVTYVADHAVRALSSFPEANNSYYGVDYQQLPGANDLRWYKNIPVPTSYMICQTAFDFFGGFDHASRGGFVHVADRGVAPGKKQWTWGNHPFGWAWDRELTDENGPYVELMAGVYTDNQPDFTYLQPYETKTFSQYWWPIRDIGPVQQANTRAALAVEVGEGRAMRLGLNVSEPFSGELVIRKGAQLWKRLPVELTPGDSWRDASLRFDGDTPSELLFQLMAKDGKQWLSYRPVDITQASRDRRQAAEPPLASEITSTDELILTAEHLEQYRHPTRNPEPYLYRCCEIDPHDYRANLMLGKRLLQSGDFPQAERHLRRAVDRLTSRHPNPLTGEAHYHLGLVLRLLGDECQARELFQKAAWSYAWRSASYYQLATLACRSAEWSQARKLLSDSLATNTDHNQAIVLRAKMDAVLEQQDTARNALEDLLRIDPLDHWARLELGRLEGDYTGFLAGTRNDAQTILDLAFDLEEAGFNDEALELLGLHHDSPVAPSATPNPMASCPSTRYVVAWLSRKAEDLAHARKQSPGYFFPSRLQEQVVLEWALGQEGKDPVAAYGLGNLLYDKKRQEKAIATWSQAEHCNNAQLYRNLAIARWNVDRDGDGARAGYLKAIELAPCDSRLIVEYDQLRSKLNDPVADRLTFLLANRELVVHRDDASVSLATLLHLADRPQDALDLLLSRRFHPWEGGEGAVLRQYTLAKLLLGRRALKAGDATEALEHFLSAMDTPDSLGEKYHLHQAKADVNYWIGCAYHALGEEKHAEQAFVASASEAGDFAEMAVVAHSPLTFYRGLSLRKLGREQEADVLFRQLLAYASARVGGEAKIDYFATSLPNLLVFEEDLQRRRDSEHHLLVAFAYEGLGEREQSHAALSRVLEFDCANTHAKVLQSHYRDSPAGTGEGDI